NLLPFVLNTTDQVIALGLGAIHNTGLGGGGPSTDINFNGAFPHVFLTATPGLTLNGGGGDDTYNIQLNTPVVTNIAIADSRATTGDAANIFGSSGADTFDVNFTTAHTLLYGSPVTQTVSWTSTLDSLPANSIATPGETNPQVPTQPDGADTFYVGPEATTAITVNGGNPV